VEKNHSQETYIKKHIAYNAVEEYLKGFKGLDFCVIVADLRLDPEKDPVLYEGYFGDQNKWLEPYEEFATKEAESIRWDTRHAKKHNNEVVATNELEEDGVAIVVSGPDQDVNQKAATMIAEKYRKLSADDACRPPKRIDCKSSPSPTPT